MSEIYFIGIDVGTSGAKAILMNQDGKVSGSASSEYSMQNPYPLWCEQNPEDWWSGVCNAIKEIISSKKINTDDIKGIGLTGQMHGLVTLNENGKTLYPCIMWNDQRTAEECNYITSLIGKEKILSITGNPVLPGFTAPKLIWLKKHRPEIFSAIKKILLPKDYIRFRLTGEFVTDVSDASGSSFLNVQSRSWSKEILDALEIPYEWMPEVIESKEISGKITKEASIMTGLKEGTIVAAGGGDQAAGAVGSGAVKEGIISVTLGTSGVVFASSDKYRVEPEGKLHAFCHAVPGKWHLMGVTLAAAGSFKWYRDTFYKDSSDNRSPYEIMTGKAATIQPGSEGLIYLPYLSGERTPYPDPDAKGTFTGFTLRHSEAHFIRALLEGVSYSLNDCYQLISNLGIKADKIIIGGGGSKSFLWRSIIADLFGVDIFTLSCTEGAPYGAAILAAAAAGCLKDIVEACERILVIDSTTHPDKINNALYNEYYPIYRQLYPQLKETFKNISTITQKYYVS